MCDFFSLMAANGRAIWGMKKQQRGAIPAIAALKCFLMLSFRFGSTEVLAMPPVFVRFIGIITIHDRVCPSDRHTCTGERRPICSVIMIARYSLGLHALKTSALALTTARIDRLIID